MSQPRFPFLFILSQNNESVSLGPPSSPLPRIRGRGQGSGLLRANMSQGTVTPVIRRMAHPYDESHFHATYETLFPH
jgi:hypothetical protein